MPKASHQLLLPVGVTAVLCLALPIAESAETIPRPTPVAVETIWIEHPSTLPAGTELAGCITYRVNTREDLTRDEWTMEAITFQKGMDDTIYLDMFGDPEPLETGDCVVIRLTEPI